MTNDDEKPRPLEWPAGMRAQVVVTDRRGVTVYISESLPLVDGDVVQFRLPQITVSS